jgi:ribonuclease HI
MLGEADPIGSQFDIPQLIPRTRNISEALSGSRQTNQRAELTAIGRALDTVPKDRDVTIVTDSQYSINCITVWSGNWRRNGWKTAAGKTVENRDLVESIVNKIEDRKSSHVQTTFEWIKGHSNHPGNVEADKLAVNGARRAANLPR